ncbi:MAG: GTP 3',8-cyclase MoaA [Proteobacteria bacterium]|nr:GTP 3',8-cyclase MoaA [Pseudomonadota bacterium]
MVDDHNRVINYLRLSVTDRCNLRCIYCMPEEGVTFTPHSEILTYEEMIHIVKLCVREGIHKVRLTGGEPLVRKGIAGFIQGLRNIEGLDEITLTTNGVLLKEFAQVLRECGISRINVSMDTLRQDRFYQITGRDFFDRVWEGINEAESLGFDPIKINVVAMRGVNDDEIVDFAGLTYNKPYHVRFIEMMPVGENNGWSRDKFIPINEILDRIRSLGVINPVCRNLLDGPARRYRLEGAMGEIGFIGALSNHFCKTCNRLRLTSCGHLRGCIFSDQKVDLKTPLRTGRDDDNLLNLIETTIRNKPKNHEIGLWGPRKCARPMNEIGG